LHCISGVVCVSCAVHTQLERRFCVVSPDIDAAFHEMYDICTWVCDRVLFELRAKALDSKDAIDQH
jgi:hypothetical protein